jgi:hypothetical protein
MISLLDVFFARRLHLAAVSDRLPARGKSREF